MPTDPTPIPAEALEAAAKVAFRRYQSEYTVSPNLTWRDFVAEIHEFVEVVAPILLAAGRTAAAEDIRTIAAEIRASEGRSSEWVPATSNVLAAVVEGIADRVCAAARVAENGADPQRPVERTAGAALDCGGCGDTIWPTERIYEFGDGQVRCTICQVKSSGRGADQ